MRTFLLAFVAIYAISGPVRASEDGLAWFIETKRAAKYARIAVTMTADLGRLDREEQAAKRQLAAAPSLALPTEGRAVCQAAAKAVVDFITAAKAGNMSSGPASYEMQYARWDRVSADCLKAIHAYDREQSAALR